MTIKSHETGKRFIQAIEKYNVAKMERLEAEIAMIDELSKLCMRPDTIKGLTVFRNARMEELREINEEVRQAAENSEDDEAKQEKLFDMLDEILKQIESEEDDD